MRITGTAKHIVQFVFSRPNFLGLASAAVWFCFSLTPSLLPRPALLQGFITGISFAVGYGVGVAISWAGRKVIHRKLSPAARRYAWMVLGVIGLTAMGSTLLIYFVGWQNDVRQLVDEPPLQSGHRILIISTAIIVAATLILCSRGVYWLVQWTDRELARIIPRRFTGAAAALLVAVALYLAFTGVVYRGFIHLANNTYRGANNSTPAGIIRPSSPMRSGAKGSVVSWESLGKQGRRFTGGGPSQQQLAAFSGQQPTEPIRIYAGVDTAATAKERARIAVEELERTHAFDRPVLVVITPTGTGWVNPQTVDALEYMWNGNTAQVAIQYSYLPSWISFLVDKDNATTAGRELFNQVYEKWSQLPAGHRPKLIAYGLSLGSYGMQAAFSGEDDLKNRTDGALFVGTPNDTALWRDIEHNRDQGSPAWLPRYHSGQTIRFADTPGDLALPANPWNEPRVIYLQHASDPVVWWSAGLLFNRPSWLAEPRGRDVSNAVRWFPVATFLHISVDQFMGVTAPDGHGHNYSTAPIAAWGALVPPSDWNTMRASKLQSVITAYTDQ